MNVSISIRPSVVFWSRQYLSAWLVWQYGTQTHCDSTRWQLFLLCSNHCLLVMYQWFLTIVPRRQSRRRILTWKASGLVIFIFIQTFILSYVMLQYRGISCHKNDIDMIDNLTFNFLCLERNNVLYCIFHISNLYSAEPVLRLNFYKLRQIYQPESLSQSLKHGLFTWYLGHHSLMFGQI